MNAKQIMNFNQETYGKRIREFRIAVGLNQPQLADKLGVHKNLVSNWEAGRSRPDLNIIPTLCELFGISISAFFGQPEIKSDLSFEEKKHLRAYELLTPQSRTVIDKTIESMLDVEEKALYNACKNNFVRIYRSANVAAAGMNNDLIDDNNGDWNDIRADEVTREADEIIPVSGDSMLPTYHNGDELLVVHTPELVEGDIGIFIVNGEGFVKEYREGGLYSHNSKKYPFRRILESDDVRVIGRVIGKLTEDDYPTAQEQMVLDDIRTDRK